MLIYPSGVSENPVSVRLRHFAYDTSGNNAHTFVSATSWQSG